MKQLFLAFTIGFILCFLGLKTCQDSPPKNNLKEIRQSIKVSEKQAKQIDQDYSRLKKEFLKLADSLKDENKKLSSQLSASKSLLRKQQLIVKKQLPCDTLRKETLVLSKLSKWQDSLCDLSIQSLQEGIAIRDSQLVMCDRSYASMNDLQKENQLREIQLSEDLKTALRSIKKKRFENRALFVGWMIMAGLTTSLFIKTQQ